MAVVLIVVGVMDLLLIAALVHLFPTVLTVPANGWLYPTKPAVLIAIYVGAGVCILRSRLREVALAATSIGLIAGSSEVTSIVLESFLRVPQTVTTVYTLLLMLTLFGLWGYSGYRATRRFGSRRLGILSAVWTALLGVLLGVAAGLAITNLFLPYVSANLAGDPDYLRSSWKDLSGFAVLNTFDNAFIHLSEAPFVAVVLGLLGSVATRLQSPAERA